MGTRRGRVAWVVALAAGVMLVGGAWAAQPQAEQPVVETPAPEAPEAGGKDWSVGLDLTYKSHYVWRGINLTDDPVFQPSLTFAWKGLSVNFWGNMDLTDVNGNRREFNEADVTVSYGGEAGSVSYEVGVIRYHFPNTPFPGTTEVYGAVGLDLPLSPTLTVYYDCDEADGYYATLGVGHTFEDLVTLSETCSMSCEVSASVAYADADYNAFYFGVADSAFVDALVSIGFPVAIGDHVTITPSASYSNILDGTLAAAAGKQSNWWTGITLGFAF